MPSTDVMRMNVHTAQMASCGRACSGPRPAMNAALSMSASASGMTDATAAPKRIADQVTKTRAMRHSGRLAIHGRGRKAAMAQPARTSAISNTSRNRLRSCCRAALLNNRSAGMTSAMPLVQFADQQAANANSGQPKIGCPCASSKSRARP